MTASEHNLDDLLARVADGRLDELTPEQVAALADHLDATPAAAERLDNVVPAADPCWGREIPAPSDADWERVWERIDSATSIGRPARHGIRRMIRLWQPLVAVAACLLLVVLWRVMPSAEKPWQVRLSDHVVVHDLEVYGDESAFIAYSGDNSGSAVIWVFEETEEM